MVSLPPPHRRRRQTSLRGMRPPRLAGDSQNARASEAAPNHGARPKAVQRGFFFASERSGLAGDGPQGQSPSDHFVDEANSGQRAAILFTLGAHDRTLRYRTANEARNPREDDQRLIQQTEPSTCSRLTAPQLDQTISGAVPEVGRDLHRSPHRAD